MDNLLVGKKVKYKNGGQIAYTCLAVVVVGSQIKLILLEHDGHLSAGNLEDFMIYESVNTTKSH